jgi:hypothetical protein
LWDNSANEHHQERWEPGPACSEDREWFIVKECHEGLPASRKDGDNFHCDSTRKFLRGDFPFEFFLFFFRERHARDLKSTCLHQRCTERYFEATFDVSVNFPQDMIIRSAAIDPYK